MAEQPVSQKDESKAPTSDPGAPQPDSRRPAQRSSSRQRRGSGRSRSAYAFPDDLERCFCRNAYRVPPTAFPVMAREGTGKPAMVELVRSDTQVLFCDLLHEGPHVWPNGDEHIPD